MGLITQDLSRDIKERLRKESIDTAGALSGARIYLQDGRWKLSAQSAIGEAEKPLRLRAMEINYLFGGTRRQAQERVNARKGALSPFVAVDLAQEQSSITLLLDAIAEFRKAENMPDTTTLQELVEKIEAGIAETKNITR